MSETLTRPELALSVRQPWAWLIVNGYKPVENRSWETKRRDPYFIHASLTFDRDGYEWVRWNMPHIPLPEPFEFERGGIVGQVDITDCVSDHESKFFFGPFGFVLQNAKPLPFKPCKGALRFFKPKFTETSHG